MKRPMLVCGIGTLWVGAILMLLPEGLPYVIPLCALVFVFYLIKPLKLRKHIIIPAILISAMLFSISLISYNKTEISPFIKYDLTENYVSGKIISVPEKIKSANVYKFTIKVDKINSENVDTNIDVALSGNSCEKLSLYDYVSFNDCLLNIPRKEDLSYDLSSISDGSFLEATASNYSFLWVAEKTPYYYCLNVKKAINNNIEEFLNESDAGLLKGMLFGDTDDILSSTKQAYRNSGISHLLAVSGLHTSLWCGLIIALLSAFKIPPKLRSAFCILFLIFFCVITGFTPSVIRSSFMTGVVLIAPFFKRQPDSLNSLGLSVVLILLNNPYTILNISFQLSAISTLGVLMSLPTAQKLSAYCNKLPERHLIKWGKSLVSTAVISFFCSIFALPVAAYYFDVFSLLSPITNIFTLTLSFYIMIIGSLSAVLGFVNTPIIKEFTILLFKITRFLMDLLTEIAEHISSVKICTIPMHEDYLLAGIAIGAVIALIGYFIYKFKSNRYTKVFTAIACVAAVFTCAFIPLIAPKHKNTLTVLNTDTGTQIIVRSGLKYAYIANMTEDEVSSAYTYLPKSTSESLDYYVAVNMSDKAISTAEEISKRYNPSETRISTSAHSIAESENTELPPNTIIEDEGYFHLNEEINFQIVDTYRMVYAIIEGNNKRIVVQLKGSSDIGSIDDAENADILVYNNYIPTKIPEGKTIIIRGISNLYLNKNLRNLLSNNENVYFTLTDGDISINI